MENDLPLSGDPASVTEEVAQDVIATEIETNIENDEGENNSDSDGAEKPQKTPEQLEINRLRKSTARLTRQREEARAALTYAKQNVASQADDSETLSLTRAELNEFVKKQAEQLAPTIQKQQAQVEQRSAVLKGLEKSLGKEGLDTLSENLEDAFGGLDDGNGNLKPVLNAVFYADNPQAILEYLGNTDNFDEAESMSSMNEVQAGRFIAKIEAKLASRAEKPKPSNAGKPLEAVKGAGTIKGIPDPSNTKAYIAWANQNDSR